jgi:NADPH-dependent 2,4-dienoyl-CoA reductase/sulfur reductase-like enzyme/nitrite reductase/ring-hydroxylating ferredoxin subunit
MSDQPQTESGPDLTGGIPANSLAEGVPLLGHVQGEPVILVRRGSEVFAIGATCSHYGGPLADGLVVDDTVRCPWHHACFSLRTGEALGAPALRPVAGYETVQRAGQVLVTGKRTRPGSVRRGTRPGASAPRSVAVVGAGAAGNSAADELRHLGFDGDIALFDRDQEAPYDRPSLSKDYLAGTVQDEQLRLQPDACYEDRRVELVRGRHVTALDLGRKRLTFDDGTTRDFGAIVVATGADPIRLAIPGEAGLPVHYLRTLADSRAIIKSAEGARRAVILGASFIGLEVAAALRARKIEVHVVAPDRRPLERVLGPAFGDFVRGLHEQHGVVFHLGTKASSHMRGGVVLEGGERLDADVLVAGIGVRPATALAEQAGLRVDNGIVVDAYLETATKGIFAVGDAARWPDPRGGGLVRIEHWVVAQRQGQAVARSIVGERTPFTDVPFFWSQHYDISINYVGHAERWEAIEIDGSLEQHDASVRYRAAGRVLAMASIFRDRESLEAELAMERELEDVHGGRRGRRS